MQRIRWVYFGTLGLGLCVLAGAIASASRLTASVPLAPQSATASKPAAPPKPAAAASATESGKQPLSTRVVAYEIDATLDPSKHTITATESLTYRNLTGQPQQTFPFHLYLNAFQPTSTFMTEVRLYGTRGNGPDSDWDPKHVGSITVKKFEVEGIGDLTGKMEFIQPDDNNKNDKTVFQVALPKPVEPGESVKFNIAFTDVMPEVVERTGYKRDFYMVGQWFPKVGVWWKNAWNCHQFHASTEFFADFGTFDVKLTVPKDEVMGAAGDLVSSTDNPDGTKTLTYHSEDVHDFSWTASPNFQLIEDEWTGSAGPVKIHLLMSPGQMRTAPRYLKALKGTMKLFDEWYGPYPYDRITVVDPPHGAGDAGGMEYPTLITAGTSWNMPEGALIPEVVTEHEFGHQYWYGMVATNEFEEAWLDEGINSYTESKIMNALYGENTSNLNFPFAQFGANDQQRLGYLSTRNLDPLTRKAWQFYGSNSYGGTTYGKTATVLLTLENIIGEDTMRRAMHTYFMRYRFTHPTGEDFLKTLEEVSGQNLRWYFDQAVYGTNVLDYQVRGVHSDRLDWYKESKDREPKDSATYRTYVSVVRKGDFIFPVDLHVTFEDGSTATEHWDGKDRWIRYSYDRKSEVKSAEINPGGKILLDQNYFDDSYTVKADSSAPAKLHNIWLFCEQWFSQLVAWIA